MLDQFIRHMSSIKVKLFFWFWLIIIITILSTRFISNYINTEHLEIPVDKVDLSRIKALENRLTKKPPSTTFELIKKLKNRRRSASIRPHNIVLKNLETGAIELFSDKPKPALIHFLKTTPITKASSWQFSNFRLTGFIVININQQNHQLFYLRKTRTTQHVGLYIAQLSPWLKLGIPLLISFVFCWLLARSFSRPIANVAHVAAQLGNGQLSVRVKRDHQRKDEIGSLARSFNQMAEKIARSMTSQRRLLGDVSHELRTPLTRLQLALGLAQQHTPKTPELTSYFERCEREIQHLDQMINNVLTLSKYENGMINFNRHSVNLIPLITAIVDDANFLAQQSNINVIINAPSQLQCVVDQQLLTSAISNIINNAIKYSPENTVVTVTLEQKKTEVIIHIADQGHGVPPSCIAQLFEPFYRVNDARDRQSGGTGLGLAIAKQAIQAHQGNIHAENLIPQGLKITITLPLSTELK